MYDSLLQSKILCGQLGTSIRAGLALGCHVLALEDDRDIFDMLIAPFSPTPISRPQALGRVTTPPVNPAPAKKPKTDRFNCE